MVIYLAGDREFHAPATTLGTSGPLSDKAAAAAELPIAAPPATAPDSSAGTVMLLRLDRLVQTLDALGFGGTYDMVFVLTRQDDPAFAGRDTHHLRPVLNRWCQARGHLFSDVLVEAAPNRLDAGGAQLIDALDPILASTDGRVVLTVSGGTPALQIATHFASFDGVQHRDQLTIVQLEEMATAQEAPPAARHTNHTPGEEPAVQRRRPTITDTMVRVVERFHEAVGRRTIETHAAALVRQLDVAGAAQLLCATPELTFHDPQTLPLAQELRARLSRQHHLEDALAAAAGALDLAELSWSQPGRNPAEALWYAAMATIDLLPAAWATERGTDRAPMIDEDTANAYNAAIAAGADPTYGALHLPLRSLQGPAGALLGAGPAALTTPGRTVPVQELWSEHWVGDHRNAALTWCSLLVALRPLRNQHAHELVSLTPDAADHLLRERSRTFDAARLQLQNDDHPTPARPVPPDRAAAVREAIGQDTPPSSQTSSRRRRPPGRFDLIATGQVDAVTDDELLGFLRHSGVRPERFAELAQRHDAAEMRHRVLRLLDEHAAVDAPPRPHGQRTEQASGDSTLDLSVSWTAPASPLRQICRQVVPELPADNPLLHLAARLHASLVDQPVLRFPATSQ